MLALCYQIAARRRVHLSELAALAKLGEMEVRAGLDLLVERELLERELALVCPHCSADHSFYACAYWPLLEQTHHDACGGDFLAVPKQLEVVYTPTEKLLDAPVARSPRTRLSGLAD